MMKDVARSSVKVPEFDKHLKKAGGHVGRNVVEITIKMKTIVQLFKFEINSICFYHLFTMCYFTPCMTINLFRDFQ